MNWPKTKKHFKSGQSLFNYYRAYVPSYLEIRLPLIALTRAKMPQQLEWGPEQQQVFETLKEQLSERPILHTPVWDRSFLEQVDASNYAVGAC